VDTSGWRFEHEEYDLEVHHVIVQTPENQRAGLTLVKAAGGGGGSTALRDQSISFTRSKT
jgi:hypothetical protein